jgi:hypothetical protein
MLISNHCYTSSMGRPDADDTHRAAMGGLIGSVNSCVKMGVDGYSLSGAMVIGNFGLDLRESAMDANNLLTLYEQIGNQAPYDETYGKWSSDANAKAVNQGTPS